MEIGVEKIVVIGLGLIGGSFALDIKDKRPNTLIVGIDTNSEHLLKAKELGVIDIEGTQEDIQEADWVIVAVPVDKSMNVLVDVLNKINSTAIVFDVGSTKSQICEAVKNHQNRRNFIAAHPIAGTEFSGPQAALKGLFVERTNIICEVEKTAFVFQEKALELFKQIGMRIRYMDPISHDKHIAYMSHLSHISSFMLGKTVIEEEKNERDIFDMAGSGFESTVRLAKSSPAMWTPIFKQNKNHVIKSLSEYIANLNSFKELLEQEKFEEVFTTLEETNRIKQILK
ncbi:prephenate dehydrogenase [Flavobacterium sp. NRK F7]|uniref:prephenate dehydrogenase n=1 Tax=Flavobacterium sp. NRK F7 TaxID=2954930 RepID=UPI002090C27E|nr:prephenate dehydrogenase [Flavobacterium sp. NRK F7]MCO6161273.1 prephenate dehydrogenase [Flavobacterium sp. NRK F7]